MPVRSSLCSVPRRPSASGARTSATSRITRPPIHRDSRHVVAAGSPGAAPDYSTRAGKLVRRRLTVSALLLAILFAALVPMPSAAQTVPATTSSLIVKVVAGLTSDQHAEIVARNGGTLTSSIPALRLLVVAVAPAELGATLARYQADPQVQSVEQNKVRVSESVPSDPLYVNQWALPKIGWHQVFGVITPTGSAKVALLDTGLDASHPELAGKVVAGTSMLDGSKGMTDPSGHGTWLAGIIAAQTDTVPVEGIAAGLRSGHSFSLWPAGRVWRDGLENT